MSDQKDNVIDEARDVMEEARMDDAKVEKILAKIDKMFDEDPDFKKKMEGIVREHRFSRSVDRAALKVLYSFFINESPTSLRETTKVDKALEWVSLREELRRDKECKKK